MNAVQTVRSGARMIFNHPELVSWYFRNKVRVSGLTREQNTMDGLSKYPLGLTFKPTLSCNLRCRMCSFVANGAVFTNPKDSLPLDTWTAVVDDVKRKLRDGEGLDRPHLEPSLPRERPASTAQPRRARGRRPRG